MCCPLYIIRCDAPSFRLSKSQKKVLKKMTAYLLTGKGDPKAPKNPDNEGQVKEAKVSKPVRPGSGPDPTKPPCRKARDIRIERRAQKKKAEQPPSLEPSTSADHSMATAGVSTANNAANGCKSLEELFLIPTPDQNPMHHLEIKLVRSHPRSPEFEATFKDSHSVYVKYQTHVHKDDPDDCTVRKYTRFLVDSPLVHEQGPTEWECGYGSYHQQYYLDGRLIMVGVIDILPNALSSKYLYYDTDYEFLTLGTFSALSELVLVRKLHASNPNFRYYCMGYYVHGCQKMNYKGNFAPSYLLSPVTNEYVPIEKCRPKLEVSKYACLSDEAVPETPVESYLDSVPVVLRNQAMPFGLVKAITKGLEQEEEKVKEYASLVGPDVAQRSLLFLKA